MTATLPSQPGGGPGAGVASFNSRTGAVELEQSDLNDLDSTTAGELAAAVAGSVTLTPDTDGRNEIEAPAKEDIALIIKRGRVGVGTDLTDLPQFAADEGVLVVRSSDLTTIDNPVVQIVADNQQIPLALYNSSSDDFGFGAIGAWLRFLSEFHPDLLFGQDIVHVIGGLHTPSDKRAVAGMVAARGYYANGVLFGSVTESDDVSEERAVIGDAYLGVYPIQIWGQDRHLLLDIAPIDAARLPVGGLSLSLDPASGLLTFVGRLNDDTVVQGALPLASPATQAATTTEVGAAAAAAAAAQATANSALPKAGGVMTGDITLAGDGAAGLHPATRQWVAAQINALINGAPGLLDTLGELATQLALDESAVAALTTTVAGKAAKAANLGDLTDPAAARANINTDTPADTRTPTNASVTLAKLAAALKPSGTAAAGDEAVRALGTTASTAAAGNDARFPAGPDITGADLANDIALPGNPTTTTQAQGNNTTRLATTAFVQTEVGLLVPKSLVDAKGDLLVGTADNTVARLAVGATKGHALQVDLTQTAGVRWAASVASDVQRQARKLAYVAQSYDVRDISTNLGVQTNTRQYCMWVPTPEGVTIANLIFYLGVGAINTTGAQLGAYNAAGTLLGRGSMLTAYTGASGRKTIGQAAESGQSLVIDVGTDSGFWAAMVSAGSTSTGRVAGRSPSSGAIMTAVENVSLSGFVNGNADGTLLSSFNPAVLQSGGDTDIWIGVT